ncbi:ESX secretion-associated protein EspG [Mycobacterium sp. Aquia_216]|uniref:ESX secretion-associated protein EspG n=1 Tax=Mycobacterium sp. Aquia_216 TaxID=2991729 RepID=UPI00227C0286|nr:ESX secretion-associated protein EspG [Mycobacterium sp. Aquia_216]WAJ46363.1 ESX secretion-associated protein EspG [Mycobacterium sp. Aquia_216]
MSTALSHQVTLTDDELRVVAPRAGVHDLPTVLASRPRYETIADREAVYERAARDLFARNLIVGDTVHPELVSVLQALHRPDRELAMRMVTPDGIARISLVRRGTLCVLVRRIADEILLRTVGHGIELRDVASALLAELPQARPADVHPVAAPLQELVESLTGTHDPMELADRIRALGAEPHAAMLLGAALSSRQAFGEIVYHALADAEDRISRGPAAVGVFYTKRGRIIGVPSASPTGQLWSTLKAGSDHALGQAISQLVELADENWSNLGGNGF